ncbi:hypothetical protein L6164_032250 [Bauhinia variegata]|uniref:Uncharacterized protein n=1 Tax=Bauhinia variegata TaxID=167791 RepID=A0ACB9KN75_BAUVA|nr:hypothetical protein L6164_032250 [Bauhinia variegata]
MTSLKILFLAMTMALACALSATPSERYFFTIDGGDTSTESEEKPSLRMANRLLGSRRVMTCDKYPRVCGVVGSRGPDCCHKKCVRVSRDRNNCGKCGNKCKYSQICCKGNCVNPMADKNHCGRCGNKCQIKGDYCQHGMCSYAYA